MKGMNQIFRLGCLVFSLLGSNAWASYTLSLSPSVSSGQVGETLYFDLNFSFTETDLAAITFDINYDSSILSYAEGKSSWSSLVNSSDDFESYAGGGGAISYYFFSDDTYPSSSGGILAQLAFEILQANPATLLFNVSAMATMTDFNNGIADPIDGVTQGASINSIPVPSAGLLFGATLLAMTARRRRVDCA